MKICCGRDFPFLYVADKFTCMSNYTLGMSEVAPGNALFCGARLFEVFKVGIYFIVKLARVRNIEILFVGLQLFIDKDVKSEVYLGFYRLPLKAMQLSGDDYVFFFFWFVKV